MLLASLSSSSSSSRFASLAPPPVSGPVPALSARFLADHDPGKVDLVGLGLLGPALRGVGRCPTDEGSAWVPPAVRQAEQLVASSDFTFDRGDFRDALGSESMSAAAARILLGPAETETETGTGTGSRALRDGRVLGAQTLGATGALRVGAELLARVLLYSVFLVPPDVETTPGRHETVLRGAGFSQGRTYRYWNAQNRSLDFEGLMEDLKRAPENAVVVLHAVGHDQTGTDPTEMQWKKMADLMLERKLFPFFDCHDLGLASGDLEEDAKVVRYFERRGFEFFAAMSFSTTMGLYGERVGSLIAVTKDARTIPNLKLQLAHLIHASYLDPPRHGARVVSSVLNHPGLFDKWKANVKEAAARIAYMRQGLRRRLEGLKTPGSWDHLTNQKGIFSVLGLTEEQCQRLTEEHHVYVFQNGRFNVCGLRTFNINYVAGSINAVVRNFPHAVG